MRRKPDSWPAFLLDAKAWRSDPTIRAMDRDHRGLVVDVRAAMWLSDEPGTLPLPIEIAARSAGLDRRSLANFVSKYPDFFTQIDGKLVDLDLRAQWDKCSSTSVNRAKGGYAKHASDAANAESGTPANAPNVNVNVNSDSDSDSDSPARNGESLIEVLKRIALPDLEPGSFRKREKQATAYLERVYQNEGRPTSAEKLISLLDEGLKFCEEHEMRYPPGILKALGEMKREMRRELSRHTRKVPA